MLHVLWRNPRQLYVSSRLYTLCIYSITLWQSLQWCPASLQEGDNKQAAEGQLKCIWFRASAICQSSGDSEGTNRPRGISCKSSESISSPSNAPDFGKMEERDEQPICGPGDVCLFSCTGKLYSLLHTCRNIIQGALFYKITATYIRYQTAKV